MKTDLKQKAYSLIKEKIVKCELLPEQDISEDMLADEMGISRTPIREALMRLEHERLVIIYPRKGMVVSGISLNTIRDVFQVREIVEPQVARMVMDILPQDWLTDMKEKLKALAESEASFWDIVSFDKELHSYLINASKNAYLIQLMDNILDQAQRIRVLSSRDRARLAYSHTEHAEIIDAFLQRDAGRVEEQIRKHIGNARRAAVHLGGT